MRANLVRAAFVLTVALVAALVLAGCGASAAANSQPVRTDRVEMPRSYKFSPAVIEVTAGTSVTWHNDDNFTHDVRLLDGSNWKSKPLVPGESVTYTFDKPGEYNYDCSFHPQDMKGKVIVVARG